MEKSFINIIPFITFQLKKDDTTIVILPLNLSFSLFCLKNHINFNYNILSYIAGIDLLGCTYRFSIVYDLLSLTFNSRVRVKVLVNETSYINSITSIFLNANWWEREIWDLFGIYFEHHPDLRRILTDYGFEGYPLRKDFPLYGYLELRYDDVKKQIIVEPLELSQDFRSFIFETPW